MSEVREQTLIGHIRCPLCLREITTATEMAVAFVLGLSDDEEDLESTLEIHVRGVQIVGGCEHAKAVRDKISLVVVP